MTKRARQMARGVPDLPTESKMMLSRNGPSLLRLNLADADELLIAPETLARWAGMLTLDELKFLRYLVSGYDPRDCARLVGWAPERGTPEEYRLLGLPAGYAYVRELLQHRITGRLSGLALLALEHVLTEGDDRAKIAAVRTVLDAAAFFGTRADEKAALVRSLGMDTEGAATPDRLLALAAQSEDEISRLQRMLEEAKATEAGTIEGTVEVVGEEPAPWD